MVSVTNQSFTVPAKATATVCASSSLSSVETPGVGFQQNDRPSPTAGTLLAVSAVARRSGVLFSAKPAIG